MSAMAWLRYAAGRAPHLLAVTTAVGAVIAMPARGALPADGETGLPSGTGAATCPSPNPPNTMTLAAGTPQSATLGSAFCNQPTGCFHQQQRLSADSGRGGYRGHVQRTGRPARAVCSLRADRTRSRSAAMPPARRRTAFTANDIAGAYTVTASSAYGSVSFSLTNAEGSEANPCGAVSGAGPSSTGLAPASLRASPPSSPRGSAHRSPRPRECASRCGLRSRSPTPRRIRCQGRSSPSPRPFAARADALSVRSNSPQGTRSRTSHVRQVEVMTDACGIALAPAFAANHRQGGYIVVASVEQVRTALRAGQRRTAKVTASAANLAPKRLRLSDLARVASVGLRTQATAGGPVGAGDRDRRGGDRGGARTVLLKPSRSAQPDRHGWGRTC